MKASQRGRSEDARASRQLPATSAALPALAAGGGRSSLVAAREMAADLEGRRRSLTLGGSLLVIPATACATLGVSAAVGVSGFWLPVCALAGLTIGLSLSTVTMAISNVLGLAAVRRHFYRQARALGLSDAHVEEAWRAAEDELEARSRARLLGGRDAMVTLALEDPLRGSDGGLKRA